MEIPVRKVPRKSDAADVPLQELKTLDTSYS
jgi:hypothetical protein